VVLGALGKREAELGGDTELTPAEKPIVRRQAMRVITQAIVIAAVGALIAYLV